MRRATEDDQAEAHGKGYGRVETRRIRTTTRLTGYLDWPGVKQVCLLERVRRIKGKTTTETVCAVTSLGPEQASAKQLLAISRGHWGIENKLHWVRDVTFDEDRSQVRTGAGPHVMATLRNTAISLLRLAGWTNIAHALRHHAADSQRPLALLTT